MNQLANSIAAAVIDAGANILAVPQEYNTWGEEVVYDGHRFKLNQHFYTCYLLLEHDTYEYLNYVQPGQQSIIRGIRQIIKGNLVSALVKPRDVEGDLGFIVDDYKADYCGHLKFAGLLEDNLFERMIAIDGVPYMVMKSYKGDGYLNVLLDRGLEQPASSTSALTGGRLDANKQYIKINDGGLFVVSPKYVDRHIEGQRTNHERHGINVRETRCFDALKKGTLVTFDVMMGIKVYPQNCQLL